MAASFDFGLAGPAPTTGLPPIPAQQLVASSSSLRYSGMEEMPPEERQEFSWQQFFDHPTLWWDNRHSYRSPWHPEFRHKTHNSLWPSHPHKPAWVDSQIATVDAGMKRPPESVSAHIQGQGACERLGHLELGMCRKICQDGQITDAVNALNLLVQRGCYVHNNLFYRVLKRCIAHKDLVLGRRIHALSIESGYEGDAFLATHLIGLYASHGSLEEAMQVFTNVSVPDVYNWVAIILAYARHGQAAQAIRLYRQMIESTAVEPTDHIYAAVLKACAVAEDLAAGKMIHAHILASQGTPDIFVQTGLVDMYAKCGSLEDARRVFDRLPQRDVVTWNAMITGYTQQGMGHEALVLYNAMRREGLTHPNSVTYVWLLQACANIGVRALVQGKQLHTEIQELGLQDDMVLCGSLVNMYTKCGSFNDAQSMFHRIADRNVVAWTSFNAGHSQEGISQETQPHYYSVQMERLSRPDSATFICLLQACACIGSGSLQQGKELHARIAEQGLQNDVVLGGSLVNMYVKCGSLEDARKVFDRLPERNVVTWNVMLTAYAQQGMGQEALSLYNSMQQEGLIPPDSVTFLCLLQACASAGTLVLGKQLHAQIHERGLQEELGNSLVNMYAKCGSLENARSLFDSLRGRNVVTWNAMIAGYVLEGMIEEAFSLYSTMLQEGSTEPDSFTFSCLLQACASAAALPLGQQLHAKVEEQGLQADVVLSTCLIDMYSKCGSLEDARLLFDELPDRDVVTWNAMLAGYTEQGMGQEALSLYTSMQQGGVSPNSVTFLCLLQACAIVSALPLGKQLHAQIEEQGLHSDAVLGTALINMYAKCGSMFDSQKVFESLPERAVEAWGALIGGYARLGDSETVFDLLDRMRLKGIQPNDVIFLSVLTLCSHVGLLDKGRMYFGAMRTDYGICASVEHYTCMIDLLGRTGHLDEALSMAKSMPFSPNGAVWRTLLGACQKWNNIEVGQKALEFAGSVDGNDVVSYVLMSDIYSRGQMSEQAKQIR